MIDRYGDRAVNECELRVLELLEHDEHGAADHWKRVSELLVDLQAQDMKRN